MISVIEAVYATSTLVFIAAGLTMAGMATRAYVETSRGAMLHLSVGFSLAVVGAVATMVGAFVTNFAGARSLLMVNSALTTAGYLFIVYSLLSYE